MLPRSPRSISPDERSKNTATVTFNLGFAETRTGELIRIVGSLVELGAWDPLKSVPLTTDAESYPSWRATVMLEVPYFGDGSFCIEYKYVRDVRAVDGNHYEGIPFLWEEGTATRRVTVSVEDPLKEVVVNDSIFGDLAVKSPRRFPLASCCLAKSHADGCSNQGLPKGALIDCMGKFEDSYEIRGRLPVAQGAFAAVWRCRSRTLEDSTLCVVKRINRLDLRKADKKNLFGIGEREGELELHVKLHHPHIVRLLRIFVDSTMVSLVMEMCEGTDVFEHVTRNKRMTGYGLPETTVASCIWQLMKALDFLHTSAVVHRDIKSENLLVAEKGALAQATIKLCDFGFAVCLHQVKGGRLHTVMGSPSSVAPEILKQMPYGTAVDLWSAGVVLHHLLVGLLPFKANSPKETLSRVLDGRYRIDYGPWHAVSTIAKDLLVGMMCVDVEQRIRSHQALLHNFFSGLEVESTIAGNSYNSVDGGRQCRMTHGRSEFAHASEQIADSECRQVYSDSGRQVHRFQAAAPKNYAAAAALGQMRTSPREAGQAELADAEWDNVVMDQRFEQRSQKSKDSTTQDDKVSDESSECSDWDDDDEDDDEDGDEEVSSADMPLTPFIYKRRIRTDLDIMEDAYGKSRACCGKPSAESVSLFGGLLYTMGLTPR